MRMSLPETPTAIVFARDAEDTIDRPEQQENDNDSKGCSHTQELDPESGASEAEESEASSTKKEPLGYFGRYLTIWVALCMACGIVIGEYAPSVADALDEATIAQVSIPVAILIWIMVYPMMLQIDLKALKALRHNTQPLLITSGINYLVQPFLMYGWAVLFFNVVYKNVMGKELRDEFIAGAVILGGSPCTAMVFIWSALVKGNAAYTLAQVALNDVLIFVFYIPTIMLLLRVTDIQIPWDTAFISVALFMGAPALFAVLTREYALRRRSEEWLSRFARLWEPFSMMALLATVVLIFTFQGQQIVDQPADVFLIAIPLILQSYTVFAIAYFIFYKLQVVFEVSAPGSFIATSNFFELAVAVAISLFGVDSGATLVTVVGVLTEVPIMLSLVWFAKKTKHLFPTDGQVPELTV